MLAAGELVPAALPAAAEEAAAVRPALFSAEVKDAEPEGEAKVLKEAVTVLAVAVEVEVTWIPTTIALVPPEFAPETTMLTLLAGTPSWAATAVMNCACWAALKVETEYPVRLNEVVETNEAGDVAEAGAAGAAEDCNPMQLAVH